MASSRRERIEQLADRVEQLIRQEEDPEGTMLWLKEKLWEPDVCHGLDTTSPEAFCMSLADCLESNDRDNWRFPYGSLADFETAEELILSLILTFHDDGGF